jgi:hypothetical protein
LTVSANANASRQDNNASSRVEAAIASVHAKGPSANDRFDGKLGLTETLSLPRSSATLAASLVQDFNDSVIGADVALSRGRRRTLSLSTSASHSFTELVSGSLSGNVSRVGYGQEVTRAIDFRNESVSGNLSWRVSERDTLTAQASHTRYDALSGLTGSSTDSADLGGTRIWSERLSAGLNLGSFSTRSTEAGLRVVCPAAPAQCQDGSVRYVLEVAPFTTVQRGTDFNLTVNWSITEAAVLAASFGRLRSSASLTWPLNERDSLSFAAARKQVPSGAGSELNGSSLSAEGAFGLTPTARGSLRYEESLASSATGQAVPSSRRRSMALSLVNDVTRDLSIEASIRHTVSDNAGLGSSARSNGVGVLLKYTWARAQSPI